jgi:hypothetical protein
LHGYYIFGKDTGMGLLTEAIFGREIVERIPIIVKEWNTTLANKGT